MKLLLKKLFSPTKKTINAITPDELVLLVTSLRVQKRAAEGEFVQVPSTQALALSELYIAQLSDKYHNVLPLIQYLELTTERKHP